MFGALKGEERRVETQGRPLKEPLSFSDNSLPKHDTRKEIALVIILIVVNYFYTLIFGKTLF